MGGFVLLHKAQPDWEGKQVAALAAMEEFGLRSPQVVDADEYVLTVYPKRQFADSSLTQFPNGDFVCTCGALLYGNAIGKEAAVAFYRDYDGSPSACDGAMGHYAVLLKKDGRTEIIIDRFGGLHVFSDRNGMLASSSFLVTAAVLDRLTLDSQAAYEYVFNGVVSGDATLFQEIVLAPVNCTIRVERERLSAIRRPTRLPTKFLDTAFPISVDRSMVLLDRFFNAVAGSFGEAVSCALSGGYDSRLILAFLRRHGVRPRLYVYGREDNEEIGIARSIAEGEGLNIDVIDKDKAPAIPPEEFSRIAYENFMCADGYVWSGIFHNGAENLECVRRVSGGAIALNGGGGEIFRNFFYLPDRAYCPRELLWSFYSRVNPRTCTAMFEEEVYFEHLEAKLATLVGGPGKELQRPTVEWLYHNFRCRNWDGRVNSIVGTFGYTALPFLERPLSEHASMIPIAWKNHGAYEAELIRRADGRLARYTSSYGHDFAHPPPLLRRVVDYMTYWRPPSLRRYSYRVQQRLGGRKGWPLYLGQAYRDAVLPGGTEMMSRFFAVDHVSDPEQMARILTLEYAARYFGSRLRLDPGQQ